MSWASEVPDELMRRPTGLVVLTGLDTTYNAVHKAIWDAFCNNRRSDRVPLNMVVRNPDHEYPSCKPKKSTYEFYIPRGILKTRWMRKTLDEVPSVMVLFWDLDWDDPQWKEKSMECATKVEIVRNSIDGRATRVCVVLIQKNPPLPPGEDMTAAERAQSLCAGCNLHAKALFVLPLSDHLLGYAIRLENAFYEMSQAYCQVEIRKIKAHRDLLNKTTHQLLYVRHQFKIAFYNEMRQDIHNALKHYKQAYSHILECRMYDTNILEFKVIAGFINYKVCRLSFQLNAPLDAISSFRKHIDFFKTRSGPVLLTFEHSAWMSKQFKVFGELFDEAIKLGLTAVQTQHPGFYYQQAAIMTISRKELSQHVCKNAEECLRDIGDQLKSLDYYGQRPWRQGIQTIEAPDAVKEREGFQSLQALEAKVEHSSLILPLLKTAVGQFQKYKSPRMKRYLMVLMAEEHYHCKEYGKALTMFTRVMDYRQERWWTLFKAILSTSLKCAYLVGSTQDYLALAIEAISPYCEFPWEERLRVQQNLMKVLQGVPPDAEPGCNPVCAEKAKNLWLAQEHSNVTVEMQAITTCVEVKASFVGESFQVDEPVSIKLFIRAATPLPIVFSKATVQLSNPVYNTLSSPLDSTLTLQPGEVKVLTFNTVTSSLEDLGKDLEILTVCLHSCHTPHAEVILHWVGCKGEAIHQTTDKPIPRRPTKITEHTPWAQLDCIAKARIRSRDSKVSIQLMHSPPCLLGEYYQIQLKVFNKEATAINNLRFSCFVKDGTGNLGMTVAEISRGKQQINSVEVTDLPAGSTQQLSVYYVTHDESPTTIVILLTYDLVVSSGGCFHCSKEEIVNIPTVKPFNFTSSLLTKKCDKVDEVITKEPFLVLTDVTCLSPWPLEVNTSEYTLHNTVIFQDLKIRSQMAGARFDKCNDVASEAQCVMVASIPPSPTVGIGTYTLWWRRHGTDLPYVLSWTTLPSVTWENLPISIELQLPAYGLTRQLMQVAYAIHNHTVYSQDIEIEMDISETFMITGHKKCHMRLLPNCVTTIPYSLFPLEAGKLPLPNLQINISRYPRLMETKLKKRLPAFVYVMPSGKSPITAG